MCIKVWNISSDAKPHKDTFKNSSVWFVQFFIILKAMYKNIAIIVIEIKEPNSSDIIAMI